ncbi:MAG: hypothetical protein OIN89_07915 [Candidatus Methanoperedens sp.]|jgi:rRNA-processing protein FCF1|nr:hypothetical protein [Candidatus Methanoperedens sp.]PKL53453.1 MAG: hypothetical protein CVV36_06950 [Candidatus Methanoperedenaceae archaeon HGW-Methanoperedenaceae-1]
MTIFAIDTCSLIALYYSGYLGIINKNADIVITKKIISELEDISAFTDDDGRAAEDVLRLLSGITIIETMPQSSGEEELIEVARQNKCDFIVSDDIRAIPKFKTVNSAIIFSSHLLYYMYRTGIISKEEGLVALEKMRIKRSWKENVIYIAGIQLFKSYELL